MKTLADLKPILEQSIKAAFPDCYLMIADGSVCSALIIRFSCEQKENWKNNIFENSPTALILDIMLKNARWEETKPENERVYYVETLRNHNAISMRKKTGNLETVKKVIEKYFQLLKDDGRAQLVVNKLK